MVAYLAVRSGPESGRQFPLDPDRPMHIGRGSNCEIMLTDPVSSRFHAVLYFEEGCWQIRDTKSRNGMLVNGQKTDHAMLIDQSRVRVGATELQFLEPSEDYFDEGLTTQTVMLDRPLTEMVGRDLMPTDPLREAAQAGNLLDLYQLSIQLLRSGDPEEVLETTGTLLRDRTASDAVGFFRLTGSGKLTPDYVIPREAESITPPNRVLVARVVGGGEAIWFSQDSAEEEAPMPAGSDAILIPLFAAEEVVGAMMLVRSSGRFEPAAFELCVAAGRLIGAALNATRESQTLRVERRRLVDRNADADELIGNSPSMKRLSERIARIGRANGCVLIRGESGTGKELVARAVHRASPRHSRPMLSVNCAAIPRDLIESQLFGHRKGAFTGADNDHIGWFQQAHTGTLFLDEIGELTLEGQAKLLRILEGHPFLPVGATEQVRVDVRVVAATNRDLAEFVREKQFREDLYYRLSVFELHVPPLRDRGEDVELLVDHFLTHFRLRHGRPHACLSPAARRRLLDYHWPGNVRQLRNVIDSAIVMADGDEIRPDDLGLRDAGVAAIDSLRLDHWEQRLIREALERTGGSIPEAAKLLGVSRATAYRKISEYEIDRSVPR
ncbi:sigma 54-interacting transcriptional regulator [Candidatus Laterigemmans baculatus]|uniref:sigma 54-interacting transcriptional regulator n=1 Tax=Candidatus Laterigemmans baculatus TaxID=2770505 RepID=UPI0013D96067|nr:sigma 54-interacting transcriptional regulator [Candidatus Laterigemmans baculatus]